MRVGAGLVRTDSCLCMGDHLHNQSQFALLQYAYENSQSYLSTHFILSLLNTAQTQSFSNVAAVLS